MINLMRGDCLERMKEIPDGSVDMVLCDLPYGTTQNKWDAVIPFEALWREYMRVTKEDAAFVLFAAQPFTSAIILSALDMFRYSWTWVKNNGTGHLNAHHQPMRITEDVVVFYRERPTYNPQGLVPFNKKVRRGGNGDNYGKSGTENLQAFTNYPLDVLCFDKDSPSIHPTQKPVALLEYLIRTYTSEGETVLDNTMGSGSTGVACVNTGRKFIGIEMDEKYFTIAEQRIYGALPVDEAL